MTAHTTSRSEALRWCAERLCALVLAFLLLRSAFAHLGNPYYFLSTVYSYQLTSAETGKFVAMILPLYEMVLGVTLLAGWWKKETHLLTALLFLGFLCAQVQVIRQGLTIPCGCFGASESLQVGATTLMISGTGAALALIGCLLAKPEAVAEIDKCADAVPSR